MTRDRAAQTEHLPGIYEHRPRGTHACRGLFAATESDGVPLWNLPWEISRADRQTAIERSRRLARRLLARGWASMVAKAWASSDSWWDVAPGEALAVLERDEPWEPSQGMFSLVATECGREVYANHSRRRPPHRVGYNTPPPDPNATPA